MYGFAPGLAFVVVGWLLVALLSHVLGRSVGRPVLRRVLRRRFAWLTATMGHGGASLLVSGRLIPFVAFALTGYAAVATHISLWRFSWTTSEVAGRASSDQCDFTRRWRRRACCVARASPSGVRA